MAVCLSASDRWYPGCVGCVDVCGVMIEVPAGGVVKDGVGGAANDVVGGVL